ncbi:hypothetical protein IWW49_005805, partial [Coemansia sp. RSA 1797]
ILAENSDVEEEEEPQADMEDNQQRRKVRRLRARYERWFGPYVTVQYGGGSHNDG